jgi:PAS domain S-box-containing protein
VVRFLSEKKTFRNMSLKWKVNSIGVVLIISVSILIFFFILPVFNDKIIQERRGKLKAVVNATVSVMDFYEQSLRRENWRKDPELPQSIDEAKAIILKYMAQGRYDRNEVFFIIDGNGTMIMHPIKTELMGRNMFNELDRKGQPVFKELVIGAQRDGECFVDYLWQSKYSPSLEASQTVYGLYFWPWNWIVCSSLYTEDIEASMREVSMKALVYMLIAGLVMMAMLFTFNAISIARPLGRLIEAIGEIQKGNLKHKININTWDELGLISAQFNSMIGDLQQNRENIMKSENKYRMLANLLPDIIYECDNHYRITYVNRKCQEILGYNDADVQQGLFIFDIIDVEVKEEFQEFMLSYAYDGKGLFKTHRIMKKNGGSIIGENHAVIIFENDMVTGLRGVIRDVTDKRAFEANLIQAQKMETVGNLAGGIAHDFNNILGAIFGSVSILQHLLAEQEEISDAELKENLDIINTASKRAADMVRQLLALSRKDDLNLEVVDINEQIRQVETICRNSFDKSIELDFSIYKRPAHIRGDETQIGQVLLNLCVNASHAMTIMREDDQFYGGLLSVGISHVHPDEFFMKRHPEARGIPYWRITVQDTGVGMNSGTLAKIFDPFYSTKEKGSGSGLGLAMVYNIVRQHNGFIEVYTEVFHGSTFSVYIPVHEEAADIIHDHSECTEVICEGSGTILVVDDEELMRSTAQRILERCGYTVICANDGLEGVEIFKERHSEIKAVLLDMVMPKMSGKDTYIEMKKIVPDVKVVLASGFKQDSRVEEVLQLGISKFLQKPYRFEDLSQVIYNLLYGDKA